MMLKKLAILLSTVGLVACNTTGLTTVSAPMDIEAETDKVSESPFPSWWSFYSDDILDRLVTSALSLNPQTYTDDKKSVTGEKVQSNAAVIQSYKDMRVGLVKAIVQNYIEYRYIQNQKHLLQEYIAEQTAVLEVADPQSAKILEIELNALLERKEEYEKRLSEIHEHLAASTKLLPEFIAELMKELKPIPEYDLSPVFLTDTRELLGNSAHVTAAMVMLRNQTNNGVGIADARSVLPPQPLNQTFGISDQIFSKADYEWRVSIGQAVRSLKFDEMGTRVFHKQEINTYQDAVTSYVLDLERILVGYAALSEQSQVLENAVKNADEMNIYKARLAALRADYEKAKTVTELFDTLNLY